MLLCSSTWCAAVKGEQDIAEGGLKMKLLLAGILGMILSDLLWLFSISGWELVAVVGALLTIVGEVAVDAHPTFNGDMVVYPPDPPKRVSIMQAVGVIILILFSLPFFIFK